MAITCPVVARPETPLPRAGHTARPDWDVAELVHGLFAARDAATVRARLRSALAERVHHDELELFALDAAVAGLAARAVRGRRPVLVPADPTPHLRLVGDDDHRPTGVGIPLLAHGELVGAVEIACEDGLSDAELEAAFRLCDAGASALANALEREALEEQARTDSLTGLLNHRSFHERLERALAVARTAGLDVAALMLDIDDFKWVNDVHGHDRADELLVLVGEALRASVRPDDAVCRLGGEEFAVVMGGVKPSDAIRIGERIRDRIASFELAPVGTVTVSVGIASGPRDSDEGRRLAACAEAAMMTAKAEGKNRVVAYDEHAMTRPAAPRGARRPATADALRAAAGELRRLGRLDETAERVAAAAVELGARDGAGVFALGADGLTAAGGSLAGELDRALAERTLASASSSAATASARASRSAPAGAPSASCSSPRTASARRSCAGSSSSPTRPRSRSRTRSSTRRRSPSPTARSPRASSRSRTRSRPATATRTSTPAGSPTSRAASPASSASTRARSRASSSGRSSTISARSASASPSSSSRVGSPPPSARRSSATPPSASRSSRRSTASRTSAASSATATSAGTARAIPTASPARPSRSRRASSSSATRSTR